MKGGDKGGSEVEVRVAGVKVPRGRGVAERALARDARLGRPVEEASGRPGGGQGLELT